MMRFVIVCFMASRIMWFGQPGHQVNSAGVDSVLVFWCVGALVGLEFIVCF